MFARNKIIYVQLLAPFLSGILAGYYLPGIFIPLGIIIAYLLATVSLWAFIKRPDFFIFPALFGLGCLLVLKATIPNPVYEPDQFRDVEPQYCLVQVEDDPQEKEAFYKAQATILATSIDDSIIRTKGSIWVYLEKNHPETSPSYGDRLMVKGMLENIAPPKNPGAFDYRYYSANKKIHHQMYGAVDAWNVVDSNKGNVLQSFAYKLRNTAYQSLQTYIHDSTSLSVLSSLILGKRDLLNDSTRDTFTTTGVMHILAVSGLHTGIIMLIFSYLLSFLDRSPSTRLLKGLLVLSAIWMFALLTGLSPSVTRAAIMFSFVTIGQHIYRQPNILNLIAASAFFQLLFYPLLLFDIGFQLSYSAVSGIVILYPVISKWYTPKWKLIGWVWDLSVVSFAAQIATLPFTLLYFHQFPVYFLLSNLIAIPAATFIIWAGVGYLIFGWIAFLGKALGWVLIKSITLLTIVLGWFENLPGALFGEWFSFTDTLLIALGIVCFIIFLYTKRVRWLRNGLSFIVIVSVLLLIKDLSAINRETLTVYHSTELPVIGYNNKFQGLLITSPNDTLGKAKALTENHFLQLSICNPKELLLGQDSTTATVYSNSQYYQLGATKIAVIDHWKRKNVPQKKLALDVLVLSGSPKTSLFDLTDCYDVSTVIIDATNSIYSKDSWLEECIVLGLDCSDVAENGAVTLSL